MGVVQQDTVIFSASAYDNIAIGRDGATREEVMAAARDAEILDFLESLPEGLDSYLGEKGIRLSGGQKQRIAIARALVRSPDILLLDEATSALDSDNEHKVQQALSRVMHGRTTLVIAHRLSTVRNADKIILIDKGVIVAEGPHDALMASNALYQKLAAHQFKEPDVLAA
jgi:ATP-binding cassette subfamily B protein